MINKCENATKRIRQKHHRLQQNHHSHDSNTTASTVVLLLVIILAVVAVQIITAYRITSIMSSTYRTNCVINRQNEGGAPKPRLFGTRDSSSKSNEDDDIDIDNSMTMLHQRMYPIHIQQLEEIFIRSPSFTTSSTKTMQQSTNVSPVLPQQFVELCLYCLLQNDVPYPDSGIRYLLRVSTRQWQQQIYQSIGYTKRHDSNRSHCRNIKSNEPSESDIDSIVSTISTTITQQNNQFGILVGEGERYKIVFPSEPIEYDDLDSTTGASSIWIECQLRDECTNQLLVIMGWQLLRQYDLNEHIMTNNNINKYYYYKIDRVDWQDFREVFRPGIGREEWMRICG